MKKQIKRYGSSKVIILTSEEMKIYELNVGDVVDVELLKVNNQASASHSQE